jgi:hypothetical protein
MRARKESPLGDGLAALAALSACLFGGVSLGPACLLSGEGPTNAPAGETREFLEEATRRAERIRSLNVRFRQERELRILRRPRVSEGELSMSGGKFTITVRGTDGEVESRLLYADGRLSIHYPHLSRLEVLEIESSAAAGGAGPPGGGAFAIPLLGGDWRTLPEDHDVALVWLDKAERRAELRLAPKEAAARVKEILVRFADFRIAEFEQLEASGNRLRLQVLAWSENEEIPPERFRLEVPAGTKRVRLDPPRG